MNKMASVEMHKSMNRWVSVWVVAARIIPAGGFYSHCDQPYIWSTSDRLVVLSNAVIAGRLLVS